MNELQEDDISLVPYYTTYIRQNIWPNMELQFKEEINKIAVEGPQNFISTTTNLLKWYSQCQGSDFMPQTILQYNLVRFDKYNYVFQNKINPTEFRGVIFCQVNPRELFEVRFAHPRPTSPHTVCIFGKLWSIRRRTTAPPTHPRA